MDDPLTAADDLVDRSLRRIDLSDQAALGVWAVGNAVEVGMLTALAVDGARSRSISGVVRLVAPIVVERTVVAGLNRAFDRDRPRRRWTRPGRLSPSSSSFPSGHASNAFLTATLLAENHRPVPMYALASGVTISRLVTRVHRLSDVVPSAIAGVLVGRALIRLVPLDDA